MKYDNSYSSTVSIRLTDEDRDKLVRSAREAGVSQSTYMRALIRLPKTGEAYDQPHVYLIDNKSMAKAANEMVRWGRHYNQAVHALNTLALLTRRGKQPEFQFFVTTFDDVQDKLDAIECGREAIEYALVDIANGTVVKGD